ncbi:ribosomal large subunit pseudouridine synthase E [Kushneria pakistanensis]|uniref:Pseudouridine synthase n=1 Tax=Kushneria pakistanensis TaxID=1508770 RepID=A0ABQ3FP12_9GAMM|nr:pseudouridine synthase [Kushneria pakistanensis]GHC30868.1 ribosomal large subunit pseudouridine synthase E [Kushneria pakistanensis]
MSTLYLFHKPFQVLTQFTDHQGRDTLAQWLSIPDIYPAGRLDYDSEGLLLLTDDGMLAHRITHPDHKQSKTYLVLVEGQPDDNALKALARGVTLKDGLTRPARVRRIDTPVVSRREPPVRHRANIVDTWLEISITEGRNRQVRRMTAHVGHPTLRLIRTAIGQWTLGTLSPGEWRRETIHMPRTSRPGQARAPRSRPRRKEQ